MEISKPTENLRFRVPPELKKEWEDVCRAKLTKEQSAITAILTWFIAQDDMIQSMVLGQIGNTPDITEALIRNLPQRSLPRMAAPPMTIQSHSKREGK